MTDRRQFLQGAAAVAGAALANSAAAKEEPIVVGLIGCGGQGKSVAGSMAAIPGFDVRYVCDPDQERLAEAARQIERITRRSVQAVGDLRKVLDDKAVGAVVIATPDHWHAPAALLAIDAGKHVYVEKPCSHNVREGRLLVDAARRGKRIVQVGTQSRSTPHVQEAIRRVRGGAIGEVLVAKAWNSQLRGDIGRMGPSEPPAHLDYEMWLGPAPYVPFQANRLHYCWHWWYAFGTGDMGNDGVHELDVARWGLGVDGHPSTVIAAGGKLFFNDDQQFPDTQYVVFDYPADDKSRRRQLVFEMRIWSPYTLEGYENGVAFYGTDGYMLVGKGVGWQQYTRRNKLVASATGKPDGAAHHQNFLESIRSGALPAADVEIGHHSATLCHLGNIAVRLGRGFAFDPASERCPADAEADGLLKRAYREGHWATPKGV